MALELAVLLTLATQLQSPERVCVARVELLGPLSALELRTSDVRSTWSGALASGERFELVLPVASAGGRDAPPPALSWLGDGAARFLAWDHEWTERRARAWGSAPAELRARPRALEPLERGPRAPLAAVVLALAGALGALAARSRAGWALAVAAVGAILAAWVGSGASVRRATRVVEVDGASGEAVVVDSAHDSLPGARLDDLRWDSSPLGPVLVRAVRGEGDVSLHQRGGWLQRWSALETQGRALGPDVNEWGLLSPVWRRDPDGVWRELAAWPRGVVLGAEAGAPGREPPGWINPAAPSGAFVILGRWADAPHSDPARETWVRWVGR